MYMIARSQSHSHCGLYHLWASAVTSPSARDMSVKDGFFSDSAIDELRTIQAVAVDA
jgi:hypothetical protein